MFDPCEHQIRQLVVKVGEVIRQIKGLPQENNVTVLFSEAAPLLGIVPRVVDTSEADRLPSPMEMKNEKGQFIVPRKDCTNCGEKNSLVLLPLCKGCTDAEGGKYRTMWQCMKCNFKTGKSTKAFVQLLDEMGVDYPTGMKAQMGIKTITDEGLK